MKIDVPDFLVVGSGKAGTTSLHFYLDQHPRVFMPKRIKELGFWHLINSDYHNKPIYQRYPFLPVTVEDYLSHFEEAGPEQVRGEVTPAYFTLKEHVHDNLQKYHSNPSGIKIIIILREPLDKIWSHFKFVNYFDLDPDKLTLDETLKSEPNRIKDETLFKDIHFMWNTNYLPMVKFYQERFDNVQVHLYDDLRKNAQSLMNRIFGFLDVGDFRLDTSKVHLKSPALYENRSYLLDMIASSGKVQNLMGKEFGDKLRKMNQKEIKMSKWSERFIASKMLPMLKELNQIIDPSIDHWIEKHERVLSH